MNPNETEKHWRCFCDVAYFHKWAIQHKDRRNLHETVHVATKGEAEYLVERLNRLEAVKEDAEFMAKYHIRKQHGQISLFFNYGAVLDAAQRVLRVLEAIQKGGDA